MSNRLALDEIVLTVPAAADHARIVRVGAAAIALRQGMSFAEIDELRAAVDGAIALLLEQPAEHGASIECVFRAGGGRLELEARRTDEAKVPELAAARFFEAFGASDVTVTVESEHGRLLMRKQAGRPGHRPAA